MRGSYRIFAVVLGSLLMSGSSILAKDFKASQASSWYPSVYGADDEIGAANLITPQVVLQAMQLVKQGKTLPLAVPVDKNFPAFRHRSFRLYNIQPG